MLYRIITQNKNRADITTMLQRYFDGFTMYRATGVYTDKIGTHIEPALVIEIDTLNNEVLAEDVIKMVKQIKAMNQQECILLQSFSSYSELI